MVIVSLKEQSVFFSKNYKIWGNLLLLLFSLCVNEFEYFEIKISADTKCFACPKKKERNKPSLAIISM